MLLRRAEPGDERAVAEVHVRSWQAAYAGLLPAAFLAELDPEQRARGYTFTAAVPTTVLAIASGNVLGFATSGPSRDDDMAAAGELFALYLDPSAWGQGVGRLLIADAREQLAAAGHTEAAVWHLVGNVRAERFYRADGWRADGAERSNDVQGITVHETRSRRALP